MKTNFKIIDNYALKFDGKLIDIHNNFDFVGFDYRVKENQLKFFCRRSFGEWVNKEEPEEIVLIHNNVNELAIENQNKNREDSLIEITFYEKGKLRKSEELTLREKSNDDDNIFYIFESGQVIQIGCEEIVLEIIKI
ncbi:hypothetical protein [Flavobacterium capsici]|uniref:Uncharacterized protein n=1 Tax=Flavobacterium capsici TaxID=3075618 RepID=A0AA96F3Y5_9FLAO|nr:MULTISPECIES: hypothetical protein [unclassified Flavobacterium]WNM18562.1 hypothetical protein RN608_11140 [Flavobacterium sp. PMR2A8]WNM22613.1 hypothetical protein RN605_04440 [Flavobacterium sp. PMTSA4]